MAKNKYADIFIDPKSLETKQFIAAYMEDKLKIQMKS